MSDKQHSLYSASASHRWIQCPGSVWLSKDLERQSSDAADEGSLAHSIAEKLLRGEDIECDPEMLEHVQYYVDYVKSIPGELKIEQRIDYSEFLGVDDAFGTADAVIEDSDTVHIIDFKYGKSKVKAVDNTQLFLYGSVFLPKRLKLHIVQPRIDWVDVWDVVLPEPVVFNLRYAASKVSEALNGSPEYKVGDHCFFCPAKAMCRAYYNETLKEFDIVEPETLDMDELAAVKSKATQIKNYLDTVDKYLLSQATNGVQIPGWVLGEGRAGNRKWVSSQLPLSPDVAYKQELRSPTEVEKILPRKKNQELWEKLDHMIERSPGKQVLVPEDPTSEFENME